MIYITYFVEKDVGSPLHQQPLIVAELQDLAAQRAEGTPFTWRSLNQLKYKNFIKL